MSKKKKKKWSAKKKVLFIFLAIVLLIIAAGAVYVNIYYHASQEAQDIASRAIKRDGNLYFPSEENKGIIIYPGGKVDEQAYAPLAKELNKQGYYVVIAKMPVRLGILNSQKAAGIMKDLPQIQEWTIVGHSLGGTSASIFVEKNPDDVDGIVFLASYPYKDLSGWNGKSLSIVGSEDQVLDQSKINESYFPKDAEFITIQGGNHAGFGDYGAQDGDGEATISRQEQIRQTADYIINFIENKNAVAIATAFYSI